MEGLDSAEVLGMDFERTSKDWDKANPKNGGELRMS